MPVRCSPAKATWAASCSSCSTASLVVDVDGTQWAEVGPGAVLGERAAIERGLRTSTLTARTACKVAVVPADQIGTARLATLAAEHRRELAGTET